ncbi:MAG: diguanylate cyclase [Kiritimatiellales bacterium]|nr:diguanylate cyclase [Kiritimatiellales bacterium]
MQLLTPTIAAQVDFLGSTLGVIAAVVASFVAITLIASYYRFQHIVKLAESSEPEELDASVGDVLRLQLARYIAGCSRRSTSFSLSLIRIKDAELHMNSAVVVALRQAVRHEDITCVYDGETAALLTETEMEDSNAILTRVMRMVAEQCGELDLNSLRIGFSSYPGHGLGSKDLINAALEGLELTSAEMPIAMPEIEDAEEVEEELDAEEAEDAGNDLSSGDALLEADDEEEETTSMSWKERRENAMLDPLTQVLKPSAVSGFMQRTMTELRRNQKKIALFCLGVNNMETITRIHDADAANDVLVEVSRILRDNLRFNDVIGRHEKHAFLVLAQGSVSEAEHIGRRLITLVQKAEIESGRKKIKTSLTLGVATYPEHGRNLHQLYTAAQKVLDYNRTNDIRAYAVYDRKIHDKMPPKPMKSIKALQD